MIKKVLYLLFSLLIIYGLLSLIIDFSGLNEFIVYGLGLPVGLILLFANKENYISYLNWDVKKILKQISDIERFSDLFVSRKKNGWYPSPPTLSPPTELHTEYYFSFNPFSASPKKCEISYKDGKIDGTRSQFYKNGQKQQEGNFKEGKEDGKTTQWHENGQIESESNWKDGECISGDCPD